MQLGLTVIFLGGGGCVGSVFTVELIRGGRASVIAARPDVSAILVVLEAFSNKCRQKDFERLPRIRFHFCQPRPFTCISAGLRKIYRKDVPCKSMGGSDMGRFRSYYILPQTRNSWISMETSRLFLYVWGWIEGNHSHVFTPVRLFIGLFVSLLNGFLWSLVGGGLMGRGNKTFNVGVDLDLLLLPCTSQERELFSIFPWRKSDLGAWYLRFGAIWCSSM